MNLLAIDLAVCNKCGKCAAICPVSAISTDADGIPFIKVEDETHCVLCGHCEAFCTSQALKHAFLPEMGVIMKETFKGITQENLSEYVRSRRSVRRFLPIMVEKSQLDKLFNVVSYAPTGVNSQMNKWVVVGNGKIIQQLSSAVIEWMKVVIQSDLAMANRLGFQRLVDSFERGEDVICRNAPTVVLGCTDAAYTGGLMDVVIATAQLELLIPSFGLGGCWAGYLMMALRSSSDIKRIVGIDDTQTVHTALMVGYPRFHFNKVPSRKEPQVTYCF